MVVDIRAVCAGHLDNADGNEVPARGGLGLLQKEARNTRSINRQGFRQK